MKISTREQQELILQVAKEIFLERGGVALLSPGGGVEEHEIRSEQHEADFKRNFDFIFNTVKEAYERD